MHEINLLEMPDFFMDKKIPLKSMVRIKPKNKSPK
jgi:hypothetical protein